MESQRRREITTLLERQSEAALERFFFAHGLSSSFEGEPGWPKSRRLMHALRAAERAGLLSPLISDAEREFGAGQATVSSVEVDNKERSRHPGRTTTEREEVGSHGAALATPTRIFIVHGHDLGAKETVARLIENCVRGAEVIVLQERAKRSQTLIEKFEEYGPTAAYAVVLMTADDRGCGKQSETMKPRARQNVILELGYFIGVLGRSGISILCGLDVEIPSDIHGVLHTNFDAAERGWRAELLKELSEAKFDIDWSRL